MKFLISFLLLIFTFSLFSQTEIQATTFNIRLAIDSDGDNAWEFRKNDLAEYLINLNSDFIGIQEALWPQVEFLNNKLEDYDFVGVGRDDGEKEGEAMVIFYKKSSYQLINSQTSWLSETPDQASKGWDAACNRTITEAIFKNNEGDNIHIFNTHFDHQGEIARKKSVDILRRKIENIRTPYLLLGDFNFGPKSELHKEMSSFTDDTYDLTSENISDFIGTFNAFDLEKDVNRRIDYIFLDRKYFKVNTYHSASEKTKAGKYLSDHFPVTVKLTLNNNIPYYQYEEFEKNGSVLPYRIMYPANFDTSIKYPVIIFLHGSGERGNNNESQLIHGSKLFQDSIQKYPAIVIFPQCPKEDYWANLDRIRRDNGSLNFKFNYEKPATESLELVIELINEILAKPYSNTNRLYIAGLSMGGFGVCELLWRIPEKITAAISICGGGSPEMGDLMTDIPIWMFHGIKDDVVHPRHSLRLLYAIQRAGGKAKITLYPKANHNSWDNTFAEENLFAWLFSKTKNNN